MSVAPLGLGTARGLVPQGCALGYRVAPLWGEFVLRDRTTTICRTSVRLPVQTGR